MLKAIACHTGVTVPLVTHDRSPRRESSKGWKHKAQENDTMLQTECVQAHLLLVECLRQRYDGFMKPKLTIDALKSAAADFAETESTHDEPTMYGVTDGKAVGTYLEHKFRLYLAERFTFEEGNSAKGIDLPALQVDMKTTSVRQPQSSCPFKSARQKIYGLGYALLVFVYDKSDDDAAKTARLDIQHVIYVDPNRTADYQMTRGIGQILDNNGNDDDLVAFMNDRLLPVDDIEAAKIAEEVLQTRPEIGYLTISNALQWRLQYKRVITKAGEVEGVYRLR